MKKDKIYLYLDDVRIPTEGKWEVVKNYDEFVAHINLNGLENYELISLDHDLGEAAMVEYYSNVKPNYDTLLYEFFRYNQKAFTVEPTTEKYEVDPSSNPYEFNSNLIEEKYIDKQLETNANY